MQAPAVYFHHQHHHQEQQQEKTRFGNVSNALIVGGAVMSVIPAKAVEALPSVAAAAAAVVGPIAPVAAASMAAGSATALAMEGLQHAMNNLTLSREIVLSFDDTCRLLYHCQRVLRRNGRNVVFNQGQTKYNLQRYSRLTVSDLEMVLNLLRQNSLFVGNDKKRSILHLVGHYERILNAFTVHQLEAILSIRNKTTPINKGRQSLIRNVIEASF